MTTREGIEIDYCPECRGVWLDRGELDKLIERSNSGAGQGQQPQQQYEQREQRFDDRRRDNDDDYRDNNHNNQQHGKHKKEGFLGDLFDF